MEFTIQETNASTHKIPELKSSEWLVDDSMSENFMISRIIDVKSCANHARNLGGDDFYKCIIKMHRQFFKT